MTTPLAYYHSPIAFQRGRGFGSVLRSIFRGIIPFFQKPGVRSGMKSLGKAATTAFLDAGHRSLNEPDTTFANALKSSSKTQAQTLIDQARSQLIGQGRKRKRPNSRKKPISKKRKLSPKRKSKAGRRVQRDIFSR